MKAILKNIYGIDIEVELKNYIPETPDNFGINVRLIIAEQTIGGEESVDVFICTPKWLNDNYSKSDIIIGRGYLIVFEFNFENIFNLLKSRIDAIRESDWGTIGNKLSYIGMWEFEDYEDVN